MLKRVAVFMVLMAAPVLAQHHHSGDFELGAEAGAITIGPRVLEGSFEDLLLDGSVWTTDAPGYDGEPGTFVAGKRIGMRIDDVLRKWNGTDFSSAALETVTLSKSVASVTTPTSVPGSPIEGFTIPVAGDGSWHEHVEMTLNSPASDGVYLLSLSMYMQDGSLAPSPEFWIVLGKNADDETEVDPAVEWVEANLVPEPASLGLLGAVGTLLLRRRR